MGRSEPVSAARIRSHDRAQVRFRDPAGPIPGKAEQLRVRLLTVEAHGPVDAVQMKHDPGEVLQFCGGRALRGDESDEDVFRAADPEKTPDICSRTFSPYTDSRVSKAMKARNGR